jgi:hypothetical protein
MEQILELMKSMQEELRTHGTKMEEVETNRKAMMKAYQEKADANQEQMKEIRAGQKQMMARMNANQVKADDNLREIRKEIQYGKAEMRSIVNSWIADMENDLKETTTCQDAMEANRMKMEPNPGETEAVQKRQENPNEGHNSLPKGMPKRDNGLPRNNGDTSGMREANLSGHGI